MSSTPPIRWVSRQELTWNEDAAWNATIDLLEHEDPASFSAEQRTAWLAWCHARELARGVAQPRSTELQAALARIDCPLDADAPTVSRALRAWCAAFEPCFVREDRPTCSS
ncbi:MAG: hypothetical protein FJ298_10930 [Planctomycetes bacterium]|nr:hypothetical protein [Planctomycetota bacterium]